MADLYPDVCDNGATDEAAPLSAKMTVFSAAMPLVKSYALAENGDLAEPIPGANLAAGTARHETLTGATPGAVLGRLPRLFSRLTSKQAIAPGSFPRMPSDTPFRITLAAEATPSTSVARTLTHMGFNAGPGLLLLDFDGKWDTPPLLEKLKAEHDGDRWAAVRVTVPGLANAAYLRRPSSSAGIVRSADGALLKPVGSNAHVYLLVSDQRDVPDFLQAVHQLLILRGLGGWAVAANGSWLVRSLVDVAVGSPERLVFEAEPILGEGLSRLPEARRAEVGDGDVLDTHALLPPGERQRIRREFEVWRGRPKPADLMAEAGRRRDRYVAQETEAVRRRNPNLSQVQAERVVRCRDEELLGSDTIRFDDGTEVRVAEILADPRAFHERTAYDPVEPSMGRNRCILYDNGERGVLLHSRLHGGTNRRLVFDASTLMDALAAAGRDATDLLRQAVRRGQAPTDDLERLKAVDAAIDAEAAAAGIKLTKQERAQRNTALRRSLRDLKRQEGAGDFAGAGVGDDGSDLPSGADLVVPRGYVSNGAGWHKRVQIGTGDGFRLVWLCGPFRVLGVVADGSSNSWGLQIEWNDAAGVLHSKCIRRSHIVSDAAAVLAQLADGGLVIAPAMQARSALQELLMLLKSGNRLTTVSRSGWIDGAAAFALPNGNVVGPAASGFAVQDMAPLPLTQRGSLDAWRAGVATLAEGNAVLMFLISAMCSSALLEPLGHPGCIFHLCGQSTTGKTSAIGGAASAWGSPDLAQRPGQIGVMRGWSATANGLEAAFAVHTGVGLCLDEIGQAQPRDVAAVAYALANATGKQRMGKLGDARPTKTWLVNVLSSGEETITALLRNGGVNVKAGQMVRVLELPAVSQSRPHGTIARLHGRGGPKEFAEALVRAARTDCGWAGPAFVGWLAEQRQASGGWAFAHQALDEARGHLNLMILPRPAGAQTARAMDAFARVAAAGELLIRAGLVPWKPDAAMDAAASLLADMLDERGAADGRNHEASEAIRRTRAFIAGNEARFVPLVVPLPKDGGGFDDEDSPTEADPDAPLVACPRGFGGTLPQQIAGYVEGDPPAFYLFNPDAWEGLHTDPRGAAQALRDGGLLQVGQAGRLTTRRQVNGQRRQFYGVSAAILEAE